MCSKKHGHRVLRQVKTRAYWKACKSRKRSCLRQRRNGRRRVLKKSSGGNIGINGIWTIGKKPIAVNPNCHENSAEFCSLFHSVRGRMKGKLCFTTPEESCSPVVVKEENLGKDASIDSLPLDVLVEIVCNVHHDELKPLVHVSSKFRDAVLIARKIHFDYTTPVRVPASRKRENTLIANESSENYSRFEGLECLFSSLKRPATPSAPKQVGKFQKPPISSEDMKEIAILLFAPGTPCKDNDATFAIQNHFLSSVCATNRVLFVEDELCEAVAQNRL